MIETATRQVDTDARWHGLAGEVAAMPDVVDLLLGRHVPNGDGLCVACGAGGTGMPVDPWPCSLHTLATEAQAIRDERQGPACT